MDLVLYMIVLLHQTRSLYCTLKPFVNNSLYFAKSDQVGEIRREIFTNDVSSYLISSYVFLLFFFAEVFRCSDLCYDIKLVIFIFLLSYQLVEWYLQNQSYNCWIIYIDTYRMFAFDLPHKLFSYSPFYLYYPF